MILCRRLPVLAVVASFLVFLPSCKSNKPPTALGPQYIMLTSNNGKCEQNGGTGVVEVYQGQAVVYEAAAVLTQFQVGFSSCPFAGANCPVNSPNGTPINVGQPLPGAVGNTYLYSGLTIDNQSCTDMGTMGIRVKGGP